MGSAAALGPLWATELNVDRGNGHKVVCWVRSGRLKNDLDFTFAMQAAGPPAAD